MKFILNKHWSGRLLAVPSAIRQIIWAINDRLADKISSLLIKKNLESVGQNVSIQKGFKFQFPNRIRFGNNVTVQRNVEINSETNTGSIEIKDNVRIGKNVIIDMTGGILIDSDVLISEGVIIYTHDHGLDPHATVIARKLIIGHDVWIGAKSIILPNVNEIGHHSIIGCGSIVTKSVPSGVIVAGNPAKLIRKREDIL